MAKNKKETVFYIILTIILGLYFLGLIGYGIYRLITDKSMLIKVIIIIVGIFILFAIFRIGDIIGEYKEKRKSKNRKLAEEMARQQMMDNIIQKRIVDYDYETLVAAIEKRLDEEGN